MGLCITDRPLKITSKNVAVKSKLQTLWCSSCLSVGSSRGGCRGGGGGKGRVSRACIDQLGHQLCLSPARTDWLGEVYKWWTSALTRHSLQQYYSYTTDNIIACLNIIQNIF